MCSNLTLFINPFFLSFFFSSIFFFFSFVFFSFFLFSFSLGGQPPAPSNDAPGMTAVDLNLDYQSVICFQVYLTSEPKFIID